MPFFIDLADHVNKEGLGIPVAPEKGNIDSPAIHFGAQVNQQLSILRVDGADTAQGKVVM
jgi:hypothetical protein